MKAIDILVVNELEAAFISGIEYTGKRAILLIVS